MIVYKVVRADVAIRENSEMLKELGEEGWELKEIYLDLAVFMRNIYQSDADKEQLRFEQEHPGMNRKSPFPIELSTDPLNDIKKLPPKLPPKKGRPFKKKV